MAPIHESLDQVFPLHVEPDQLLPDQLEVPQEDRVVPRPDRQQAVFKDLLESDVERLHILITRHAKLTGSQRAADILADWKSWLPKFRKVMPVEYRRALKELKANADAEPKIAIGA